MQRLRELGWIVGLTIGLVLACLWTMCTGEPRHLVLAGNTLLLSGLVCAISLPIGCLLAMVLVRTDLPWRKPLLTALGLMLFVPLYLQAAGWMAGFGPQGWQTLMHLQGELLTGWRGAVWVHALAAIPWVLLIVGAGLWFVEPELEEAAALDGSPWQVLRSVTMRRALGAVGVAGLWVGVSVAAEMTVTDLFQIRTFSEELYTGFAQDQVLPLSDEGSSGTLTDAVLPGVGLTAWLVLAGLACCAQLTPADLGPNLRTPRIHALGCWRWPLLALVFAIVLFIVGTPLANLAYKAGVVVTQANDGLVRQFALGKMLLVVVNSPFNFSREFGWSFLIAGLAANGAVLLAAPLASAARRQRAASLLALLLMATTLALPGPLIGLGLIWLFTVSASDLVNWLYDQSIAAPLIALTIRALPLTTFVLWHALRTVPTETLDSAATEGAGRVARLIRIALPQRKPAIAVAWLVAFAVALGDLAMSILVVPPGVTTLSIRIFSMIHYGQEDEVAGICLAMVALFVALAAMAGRVLFANGPQPR